MANPKYHARVLRFYNRMAKLYDSTEFSRKKTRGAVLEICDWKTGDKVLDLCTGTGEMALAFSREGLDVTGIDLAEGMLKVASNKPNPYPSKWLEMDAENLDFPDKVFDITTIALALHHMPEGTQIRVLSEAARVTKRQIVIVEYNPPEIPKHQIFWSVLVSFIDQSEHMRDWAQQDFPQTCAAAGSKITKKKITTWGLHQVLVLEPIMSLSSKIEVEKMQSITYL
jgi:ubiquinone/menaquinone biosynthesis C-methylase UbiE